jgi:ribosomal protein S18 acetylase RimI-like enzyme
MKESSFDQAAPVTLRPVTSDDESFLYRAYASTRADELARVPWNEAQREAFLKMQFAAQQLDYRTRYPAATHDIILLNSIPVGRVYVDRRDKQIYILDITVLPEHRNKGAGTTLIKRLMSEAADSGKSLTIYVESFNPSCHLFERLGFLKIADDGVNYLMEWRAEQVS